MWEVVVRRELRPVIDALAGKGTGYRDAHAQLERDPCLIHPPAEGQVEGRPFAYRLTGPLEEKVCGTRLRRGYRIAFSMRSPNRTGIEGIVEILYVGERDTRDRNKDVWTIIHDLFGVENPPNDHLRPPCCEDEPPDLDQAEIEEFMRRLRRLLRGR